MKYTIGATLLMASPALAHTGAEMHFHYGEALAALLGLCVYGLILYVRCARS